MRDEIVVVIFKEQTQSMSLTVDAELFFRKQSQKNCKFSHSAIQNRKGNFTL